MKSPKLILFLVGACAVALLATAVSLQIFENMAPCPYCVMQRYAFFSVALICLVTAFAKPRLLRIGAGLGLLSALSGLAIASKHLWIKAHPALSCGIDPLETSLNKIFPAKLLPVLFQADGFCTTDYDPILGLSIPQWSFTWFVLFVLVLGWLTFRRQR